MVQIDGVKLALIVGAAPTVSMMLCSLIASHIKTKPQIEAIFQNFAAGLILAAVAGELFPLLSKDASDESLLPNSTRMGGVTIGFAVALLVIYGLEIVVESFEENEDDVNSASVNPLMNFTLNETGIELVENKTVNNVEYYKKIANVQGVEIDDQAIASNGLIKLRAKSHDSSGEVISGKDSPGKPSSGKDSPGKAKGDEKSAENSVVVDVRELSDQNSDKLDDKFIGFGLNSIAWEEQGIIGASNAISDPRHRTHVVEHVQELVQAAKHLEIKANMITEGTEVIEGEIKVKKPLPRNVSDAIAEEMDRGVHDLQYLVDHCRRLLQGTEFEVGETQEEAPVLFNHLDDDKKAQLKRRVRVLVLATEHILEHMTGREVITADVLQEIYMHMDEVSKHLEFFHESVEHVAARWSKRNNLPTPELGALVPFSLVVPVTMDCFTDGLLIGVSCAIRPKAGIILAFANMLEMGFLGIAFSWRLAKCTGSSKIVRNSSLYLPPLVMWASAVLGGYLASSARGKPLVFVSIVAFGVVALLYLVCNELLIEAREAQGEDGKWWISIWIFLGVWLVLILDPVLSQ